MFSHDKITPLKNCPKCGKEPIREIRRHSDPLFGHDSFQISCHECNMHVESEVGPNAAADEWNEYVSYLERKMRKETYMDEKKAASMLGTDTEKLVNLVIDRINEGANISAIIYLYNEGNMQVSIFPHDEDEEE